MKNSAHVEFNNMNLDNIRFIELNSYPAIGQYATANYSVDQSIDEPTLSKNNENYNFNDHSKTIY